MTVTSRIDLSTDPVARHARVSMPIPAAISGIGRLIGEIRRRRKLAELSDLDDRVLRDIGLTRGEIREAVNAPLTEESVRTARRLSARRLTRGD